MGIHAGTRSGRAVLAGAAALATGVVGVGLTGGTAAGGAPDPRDVIGKSHGLTYSVESTTLTPDASGPVVVRCPRKTAVTGGGTFADSAEPWQSRLVASAPQPVGAANRDPKKGWISESSTATGPWPAHTQLSYAICSNKPSKLTYVVKSKTRQNPGAASKKAICPRGTVVTGGGAFVGGDPYEVTLNASAPHPASGGKPNRGWFARAALEGERQTLIVFAICSKQTDKYSYRHRQTAVPAASFDGTFIAVDCGGGSAASGGGAAITGDPDPTKGVLTTSSPQPAGSPEIRPDQGWIAEGFTSSNALLTLHAYAICKK